MKIPQIVFQTSLVKPEEYVIDKILSRCAGWQYCHFNDDEAIHFLNTNPVSEFPGIVQKFHTMPSGPHKADLFRYYFLYVNGGVYIDSDAMIEINIESIVKDYDFFSVKSSAVRNSIFQGFIGSIPKHDIIYRCLRDAYNINVNLLVADYHLLCKNMYCIINERRPHNICLYDEKYYDADCSQCYNENNEIILSHYYRFKIIPH